MMRTKRPRASHARTRGMSEDLGDDALLHMDPRVMTERQQLAFLLRTTAHEQSSGDSSAPSSEEDKDDEDGEDEEERGSCANSRRTSKRAKPRIPRRTTTIASRASPRNTRKTAAMEKEDALPVAKESARSVAMTAERTRSTKKAPMKAPTASRTASARATRRSSSRSPTSQRQRQQQHQRQQDTAQSPTTNALEVKTLASPVGSSSEDECAAPRPLAPTKRGNAINASEKTSPSSTSDVAHMDVFDDHGAPSDFWSLHCALCCQSTSPYEASAEALFLCASCDKKYPTQRALGRV